MIGSQVVSLPLASSSAAFVVPSGHGTQAFDTTRSLTAHNVAAHSVPSSVYPMSQLEHMFAPLVVHEAPAVTAVPLSQPQVFMTHSVPTSVCSFSEVTLHSASYDEAPIIFAHQTLASVTCVCSLSQVTLHSQSFIQQPIPAHQKAISKSH